MADRKQVAKKVAEELGLEKVKLQRRIEELEVALAEIDDMLDGGLPITLKVKSFARRALEQKGIRGK